MKVEQAKQIASKAIEQLSQALEAGHSETLRQYLAAMARFHRYSLAKHDAHRIAEAGRFARRGLSRLAQAGRFVKKGEKGILILAPIVRRKDENNERNRDRRIINGCRISCGLRLRHQPDGRPRTSRNRQRQRRSSRVP